MGTIQIGARIAARRREKGITQEELANYLGVSKPAVSKWESGQSYPDILLLPELAAYFNISVDNLIGYEPQMTKEEIRKLYHKLSDAFAKEPFDKVYEECREYIKKYYSCWQLQLDFGLLLFNHMSLAGSEERMKAIIEEILQMFQRVSKSSEDISIAKQAVQYQALCYLSLQKPAEAIDLLENLTDPLVQSDMLLIRAYRMNGNIDKAVEYIQGFIYVNLINILGTAPDIYQLYASEPDKLKQFSRIYEGLSELFEIEQLHPAVLLNLNLAGAHIFAAQDDNEKALDYLEKYLTLASRLEKEGFKLKGNYVFDKLEKYFAEIDIDTAAPRNKKTIWKDVVASVLQNPAFEKLKTEERFKEITGRLKDSVDIS